MESTGIKKKWVAFDNEFVIGEVNANYNFWWKKSTDPEDAKFKLLDSFLEDPWNDNYGTIGQQMSTKKPGVQYLQIVWIH